MPAGPKKLSLIHVVIVIVLSIWAVSLARTSAEHDGLLRVYFLDVGQGDAMFIQGPNGNQVLIDGGPDNSVLSELARVMPFYDHDIDLVMVSHPHSDHISGLIEVLDRYDVHAVVEAKEKYDSPQYLAWEDAVKNENSQNIEAITGTTFDLGNGATLAILHPFNSFAGTTTKKPHDDVVVAMLKFGNTKILFTGDMEARVEQELIDSGAGLNADVLKVGHHGSKTSTSDTFLAAVSPQVAFIEVGAHNRYHHPSPGVLTRLESSGIPYYRTDTDGHMELATDGEQFSVFKY